MTTIYLVRHGEAEGNVNKHCHGVYDSNLTENGIKQAQLTSEILKDIPFDAIYASGLKRAKETAKIIAKPHNLEIIINEDLHEINVGDWEDMTWEEINKIGGEHYEFWKSQPHLMKAPNGESMIDAYNRISKTVTEIVESNIGKTICIVSHCCVLKNLISYINNRGVENINENWICNASYSIAEYDENNMWSMVSINNASHLEELGVITTPPWKD